MTERGVNGHDWEGELRSLEDSVRSDPIGALPELDSLVARMLEETGLEANDEARREFAAAHEITLLAERDDDISPGDMAAAINGYRAVFDYVVALDLPES